jgi:hypothetical protein
VRRDGIGGFILRTFAWLPVCLAAWYAIAPYHGMVAGWLARVFIDAFQGGLVEALEREGRELAFVTRLEVHPTPETTGVLVASVNPLIYTYGLAFFVALMLASRARGWALLAGVAALLPFQAWGIAFDFLAQVGVRAATQVIAQTGLAAWKREAIALGYQMGSLILPPVAPVLFWAGFNRGFLAQVLGPAAASRSPPPAT